MTPEANSPVTLLFVNANDDDFAGLNGILADRCANLECQWELRACASPRAALRLMSTGRIPIVLCDQRAGDASWKTLVEQSGQGADAPYIIVTSRIADDHLWSEALNLGAYDVLSTPFDGREVARVLGSAWEHWKDRAPAVHARHVPAAAVSAAQ
jgi:DNA-binding NtrC family response regulator